MSITANNIKNLYSRLTKVGLPKKFVQSYILPEWWDNSIADTPAGYAQVAAIISKNLAIPLDSIYGRNSSLIPSVRVNTKFKKSSNIGESEIVWARVFAKKAAEIVCTAVLQPFLLSTDSASEIRNKILAETNDVVNFQNLIVFCWKSGIPVIHIGNFPKGTKKPDGMVMMLEDRPVIIISKNQKSPSWLLFILAHELGHICCNHLSKNSILVDERISQIESNIDKEENEANEFALEVLTGNPYVRFTSQENINAQRLVKESRSLAETYKINAGTIILGYAKEKNFFPVANAALSMLDSEHEDAIQTIETSLRKNLHLENISSEDVEYLLRLIQADADLWFA